MPYLRQATPADRYEDESLRPATFWDSPLGRVIGTLLPQSQMSLDAPDASIMDTIGDRLRKVQAANEGPLQEASLGLGMGGSPGMVPVAAPVLFQGRPWLRDLVGSVAGKKWTSRYSQDIPKPTNEIAREAVEDYLQSVGNEPANIGLEWEARSRNLPPSWHEDLSRGGLQSWESKLPPTWRLKSEVMSEFPDRYNPGQILYPGEAITKRPYRGMEDLNRFFMEEGPQVESTLYGGRLGGGGHLHASINDINPNLARSLWIEGMKAEPYIFPPRPAYKQSPTRTYVRHSLEELRKRPSQEILWGGPSRHLFKGLPGKEEGSIGFRQGLSPQRPEFRMFYSPETTGEWGENILAAQALIDMARQRAKSPMPTTVKELLDEVYSSIEPNAEMIRDIHRNRWYPEGIHEEGSPYANGLVYRPEETLERWSSQQPERSVLPSGSLDDFAGTSLSQANIRPQYGPEIVDLANQSFDNIDDILSSIRRNPEGFPRSVRVRMGPLRMTWERLRDEFQRGEMSLTDLRQLRDEVNSLFYGFPAWTGTPIRP